jgi:transposase
VRISSGKTPQAAAVIVYSQSLKSWTVSPASVTDRDAVREVLFRLHLMYPEIANGWADSAYADTLAIRAKTYLDLTINTVRRPPDAKGFVVLPRRWAVERSLSGIMRARRHCRGHERLPQVSESLITWASLHTPGNLGHVRQ